MKTSLKNHLVNYMIQANKGSFYIFLVLFLTCSFPFAKADSYRLSSGDTVNIRVFGEPDLSMVVKLNESGAVSYPLLGEIEVKGKTVKELEHYLTAKLKGRFLLSPNVQVSIDKYRPFFINGEVKKSGSFAYVPNITIRKAVAIAGGLTERASPDRIFLVKENDSQKKITKVDLDAPVHAGDIINIYEHRQIIISGEVKNPGMYDYQPELTLRKVVALAGGLTPRASESKIRLLRKIDSDKIERNIPLDFDVEPGDIITIGERFF